MDELVASPSGILISSHHPRLFRFFFHSASTYHCTLTLSSRCSDFTEFPRCSYLSLDCLIADASQISPLDSLIVYPVCRNLYCSRLSDASTRSSYCLFATFSIADAPQMRPLDSLACPVSSLDSLLLTPLRRVHSIFCCLLAAFSIADASQTRPLDSLIVHPVRWILSIAHASQTPPLDSLIAPFGAFSIAHASQMPRPLEINPFTCSLHSLLLTPLRYVHSILSLPILSLPRSLHFLLLMYFRCVHSILVTHPVRWILYYTRLLDCVVIHPVHCIHCC